MDDNQAALPELFARLSADNIEEAEAALNEIVKEFWPRIYAAAFAYCNDPHEAQAVANEGLMALWQAARAKRKKYLNFGYLLVSVIFIAKKRGKRLARRRATEIPVDIQHLDERHEGRDGEMLRRAKELLDSLEPHFDPEERVILLAPVLGLSIRETSAMLGISETNCRRRLASCTKRFEEVALKNGIDPNEFPALAMAPIMLLATHVQPTTKEVITTAEETAAGAPGAFSGTLRPTPHLCD